MALNSSSIHVGLSVLDAAAISGGLSNLTMVQAVELVLKSGFNDNNTFYDLVLQLGRVFTAHGESVGISNQASLAYTVNNTLAGLLGLSNDTTGLATPLKGILDGLPHTSLPLWHVIMSNVLMGVTLAIVMMRVWRKHVFVKKVTCDDWTILMSLFLVTIHGIIFILTIKAGIGRHVWDATMYQIVENIKPFALSRLAFSCSTSLWLHITSTSSGAAKHCST